MSPPSRVAGVHRTRVREWDQAKCNRTHRSPFVGFNKLPKLPGNENVPPPPEMVAAARQGLYLAKCDPSILDIIARARRLRTNHPALSSIYILSNGDYGFVAEAKKWLESDGWDRVLTSADVAYKWEDREIVEAVDTEIARRSGVFVGNGVSIGRTVRSRRARLTIGVAHLVLGVEQQRRPAEECGWKAYRFHAILVATARFPGNSGDFGIPEGF